MIRAGDLLRRMEALPMAGLDAIASGTALVLAPHPDDETLGCGGLIAEACAQGRPPLVLVVTDGAKSHPSSPTWPAARLRALRQEEARAAVAALGLPPERIGFLGLPDTQAPRAGAAFDAAVTAVAGLARRHDVSAILATWRDDPHGDHQAVHRIGEAAAREAGARLLSYPVWGWTLPPGQMLPARDVAGLRLDITAHLPAKRRAIAAHASQTTDLITDDPHGFRLPPEFLSLFLRPYEVFLA